MLNPKRNMECHGRDRADLALDGKLRDCDVIASRMLLPAVHSGIARRSEKTGRPVRFELSEQTRQAVDDYLKATGKPRGEFSSPAIAGPIAA